MSVIINTNSSATAAANNLAGSNALLQKSLNRLSSGSKIVSPADDAGGLAVSMKLSAAAKRQGAVSNNIGNAVSLMQTQDGVLKVTGAILNRISELKVLNADITKGSSDKANYNTEFKALQAQITASATETFNGVALFGTTDLSVGVTENGNSSVTAKAVPLLGTTTTTTAPVFAPITDNFADLSQWTDTSVGTPASVSGNVLSLTKLQGGGSIGWITSNATVSGAFELSLDFQLTNPVSSLDLRIGSGIDSGIATIWGSAIDSSMDSNWHNLRVSVDAAGNASSYLDGSSTALSTKVVGVSTPRAIGLISNTSNALVDGITKVENFSVTSNATTTTTNSTLNNVGSVANATDLSSLSLSTITGAIQDTATYRAENGATQSRLGVASELVATNKANLEAANSRIIDVDVASESTQLARFNILVQAGTAMLSQANQSSQMALKLLS